MDIKTETVNLLIIDDEEMTGLTIRDYLRAISGDLVSYNVEFFSDSDEGFKYFKNNPVDVVILDMMLKENDGMRLLKEMKALKPEVEIIILTGYGSGQKSIAALKVGAFDFLSKPFVLASLEKIILKAYSKKVMETENRITSIIEKKISDLETSIGSEETFIGNDSKIKEIIGLVSEISKTDCNVLIQGESGTGKELIARLIHKSSNRSQELFFPINCGAIPENLLESELFGYEKGAFTGANTRKLGLFEVATKGTIFLDEIGDLPLTFQVKLLRVLERGEFNRIGGTKILKTETRVISATNKDLRVEVEKGLFRRDLYYRLNVITITLPPLRERILDIPLLVEYFLKKNNKTDKKIEISKEAMEILLNYNWPGNVRELQNVVDRIVILSDSNIVTPEIVNRALSMHDNYSKIKQYYESDFVELVEKDSLITLEELEKRYIKYVFKSTGYNKAKSAYILGISERTLYRKMKQYGFDSYD